MTCLSVILTFAVIDRIEPPFAIVELNHSSFIDIPLNVLPPAIHEGQQLTLIYDSFHCGVSSSNIPQSRQEHESNHAL